jgi:hypothetical protein
LRRCFALRGRYAPPSGAADVGSVEGLELKELSVGLAISIDGDIGIASAEASIELKFEVL